MQKHVQMHIPALFTCLFLVTKYKHFQNVWRHTPPRNTQCPAAHRPRNTTVRKTTQFFLQTAQNQVTLQFNSSTFKNSPTESSTEYFLLTTNNCRIEKPKLQRVKMVKKCIFDSSFWTPTNNIGRRLSVRDICISE